MDNTAQNDIFSPSRILYIDEYLAIFQKYAGDICESWTSACKQSKNTYVPEIFLTCQEELKKEHTFCQCFNRLDRPVSGANLLLFDKSLFPILQNQFTNNQKNIRKMYWAVIEGVYPKNDDFQLLDHYIRFDASKQKAFVYDKAQNKTKRAQLEWRSIGHGDNYSFIEVKLITGRTHQIRAQLARIGLHIKGDVKYGAKRQDSLPGIRLHAQTLQFIHPKSKEKLSVECPLPTVDPLWAAFMENL